MWWADRLFTYLINSPNFWAVVYIRPFFIDPNDMEVKLQIRVRERRYGCFLWLINLLFTLLTYIVIRQQRERTFPFCHVLLVEFHRILATTPSLATHMKHKEKVGKGKTWRVHLSFSWVSFLARYPLASFKHHPAPSQHDETPSAGVFSCSLPSHTLWAWRDTLVSVF